MSTSSTQTGIGSFPPSRNPTRIPSIGRLSPPPTIIPTQISLTTKKPTTLGYQSSPSPKIDVPIPQRQTFSGSLNLVIFLAGVLGIVIVIQVIYMLYECGRSKLSMVNRDNVGASTHNGNILISQDIRHLGSTETESARESSVPDRTIV